MPVFIPTSLVPVWCRWLLRQFCTSTPDVQLIPSVDVRLTPPQVGDYSVSLKAPGRNKHFRVEVKGALYCIGQRKFHTLDQLVDHYQRCPIYTNPQGEKLYLIRPLPRQ